jgi:hypothetical protein
VAQLLLILDDSSPSAVALDTKLPPSAAKLRDAIAQEWPRLAGRIELLERSIPDVELASDDLAVSAHACGALTDRVLDRAIAGRARIAVLPCCHDAEACSTGGLEGWLDAALAIDVTRAARLRAEGYRVFTQTIPATITPKNRLLLASPE